MVEFDDFDQLNDGKLEPISPQGLTQKRFFQATAKATKNFIATFIDNFVDKDIIDRVIKYPQVKVDKRRFLQQQFANSPCLDEILLHGPQSIFELERLKQDAREMVSRDVKEIFAAGGTPRYLELWNHAVRMIQQILYMFGEDELPNDAKDLAAEIKKHANSYGRAILILVEGWQLLSSRSGVARKSPTGSLSVKSSVNSFLVDSIKGVILERGGFQLIDELMDTKRGGAEPGISGEHR